MFPEARQGGLASHHGIDGEKIRLDKTQIADGIIVVDSADYKIFIKDVNGNSRTVKFKIK